MSNDELFLYTLDDLRGKIAAKTEYNYIRACGLLRHLLVDENTLISIVNRKYKSKYKFKITIRDLPPLPAENFMIAIQGVKLEDYKDGFVDVKLSSFLAKLILRYNKHVYSVLDVINYVSHIMGGIHSYGTSDERDEYFVGIDDIVGKDESLIYKEVEHIANITLNAFAPLEALIKSHTPAGGF